MQKRLVKPAKHWKRSSRYVDFMALRDRFPYAVPTRDISICWSADLLRPTVGKIIDHNEERLQPHGLSINSIDCCRAAHSLRERPVGGGQSWRCAQAPQWAARLALAFMKHPLGAGVGAAIGAGQALKNDSVLETGAKTTADLPI